VKISDIFPTNAVVNQNTVVCKLWGLVGSPIEFILALSVFNKLRRSYPSWTCWVYSNEEYRQVIVNETMVCRERFVLVPNLHVEQVGDVDLAIFIPGLTKRPLLVMEADGHQFHERTPDQASNDRRRDRTLLRQNIPVFRFTGTDVVRGSEEYACEIVDYINERAKLSTWRVTPAAVEDTA
jgi:hypothetical protein